MSQTVKNRQKNNLKNKKLKIFTIQVDKKHNETDYVKKQINKQSK